MIFVFFGLLMIFFKWSRLIFFLILLEFLLMGIYFNFSYYMFSLFLYGFLVFSVISSVFGLTVILLMIKTFGGDKVFFWSYIMF